MKHFQRFAASAVAVTAIAIGTASAYSNYLNNWRTVYPNSSADDNVISGTGQSCALCHFTTNGGKNWNGYGWKMRQNLAAGQSVNNSIINAGPFDSDADPTASTNDIEIGASTQPGWTPGPHNTEYFDNGTTTSNLNPPAIAGSLDPACGGSIAIYCTAKVNSLGCTPSVSSTGAPQVASCSTQQFNLTVGNLVGNKNGLWFYGTNGLNGAPFQGGHLCVKPAVKRLAVQNSGGSGTACDGVMTTDFNARICGGTDAALTAGALVGAQAWSRDPADPFTTSLSNALSFSICP